MTVNIAGYYKQATDVNSGHPIHKLYSEAGEGFRSGSGPLQPNLQSTPTYDAGVKSYQLPYPNAPHDGGPQDLANTHAIVAQESKANNIQYAIDHQPTWLDKLALMANVGLVTAGIGGVVAPAVSGAIGGTTGAVAGGAATGAAGGLVQSALTGKNLGKNVLTGAVLGGLGGGLKPVVGQTTGLTGTTGNIVNSGITKGITGAVGGAISGQGAGSGATAGALSGVGGAVGGSIFNSPGSTVDPGITQASNPNVADFDSMNYDPGQYDPFSGVSAGDQFNNYTPTDLGAGSDNYGTGSSPNYLDPSQLGGGGGSAAGAQAGSSLGGLLSKLFGGAGGTGGLPAGLLQQLLGAGLTSGGNYLDKKAAVDAANNYANKSKFNPYTINGANGSTSFNGTTANSTLSPQQQQIQKMLQGLSNSSGASLAAGPQGAINSNFNALQSADLQAQQRLLGNTQDDEFSHGVLGSTAGGYQTQGALQAIGAQTGQNYNTAVQNANTQQQQQLAQLTGSLNGNNAINAQQMAQMGLGLDAGSAASKANSVAYAPGVAPNSQSLWGNLLQGFGNNLSSKGP